MPLTTNIPVSSPKPAAVRAGGKSALRAAAGKSIKSSSSPISGPMPVGAVPAHMARRVESGSLGLKGKWTDWPGVGDGE